MEFFDLNIPYTISTTTAATNKSSTTRLRLAAKAMELGYSGIAYNYTIKGTMSQSHRCSIPLFTPSSLPSPSLPLTSSVNFHRHLLNVAVSSPFRQYTRLTVIVDSPSQAAALNSGNPVLNTYDLVAVCPLTQNAFEHACQTAQVDIISIDFSDKLPFRLKQSMIKAAIERGVYFEITYSNLIFDAQVRRQMISNAKLLVDWTRGKNLIFSSGAASVTELRGPYDAANLSSLLGLSLERAKAAISKNCRSLIANALREKHYYKGAIKVEIVPAGGEFNLRDCLNWDPISSGKGDLALNDMEKSFATSGHVPRTPKAIDFSSALNGLPSHGLQVCDIISSMKVVPKVSAVGKSSSTEEDVVVDSVFKIFELPCSFSDPSKDQTSSKDVQCIDQTSSERKSEISSLHTGTVSNFTDVAEKGNHTVAGEELKDSQQLDPNANGHHDLRPLGYNDNKERNLDPAGNITTVTRGQEAASADRCAPSEISTPSKVLTITPSIRKVHRMDSFSAELCTISVSADGEFSETDTRNIKERPQESCAILHEVIPEGGTEAEDSSVMVVDELPNKIFHDQTTIKNEYSAPEELPTTLCDLSMHERLVEREKSTEAREVLVMNADESPVEESNDKLKAEMSCLVNMDELMEEKKVRNQNTIEDHAGKGYSAQADSPSERGRLKRSASRRIFLLPFKHLLRPRPFKKKARKLNHL